LLVVGSIQQHGWPLIFMKYLPLNS